MPAEEPPPPPTARASAGAGRPDRAPTTWLPTGIYGLATRGGLAAVGIGAAYAVLWFLGTRGVYDLAYAQSIVPALLLGLKVTLEVLAVVIPGGFALGLTIGYLRTSRSRVVRGLAMLYVEFFRSMPPLVLIAFSALIGIIVLRPVIPDPALAQSIALWLGVLALTLHTAAYQAEIVRAGILSVPSGQTDAAQALGISRGRTLLRVVLPQAFRVSLPALGNEFSSVIKDSSLLSFIGWLELSNLASIETAAAVRLPGVAPPIVVYLEVAVLYFVVTFTVNTIVRGVENAFRVPGLEGART